MSVNKKRSAISLDKKIEILKIVDNRTKSYEQIAQMMSLPRSTVAGIVRNRNKYESNEHGECKKRKKMRCGNYPDLDKALIIWIQTMRHANVSINGTIFKEKAQQLSKKMKLNNFRASDGWLDRFKKRNAISFKEIVGESSSVPPEICDDWIKNKLPGILEGYEHRDVFNLDETALFFKLMPNKTLAFKNEPCRGGKLIKDRVTILLGANSNGSEKLPILLIGKSAKPRAFKNIKTLPLLYAANKKAWMISTEWNKYIKALDKQFKKQNRKVLFVIDNAPPHLPIEGLDNIKIEYLPPNTTSLSQPMDQGIIKNFKLFYREYVVKEIINRIGENPQLNASEININLLDAVHFVSRAWERVKPETIANCFKKAGLYLATEMEQTECELIVQDREANLETLWSNPTLSDITNHIDLNDFVTADDLTTVCEELTDDDLVDLVQNIPKCTSDDSDTEFELVNSSTTVSSHEVIKALKTVRMFLSINLNTEEEINKLHFIENSIDSLVHKKMRQEKITSYLKKA